MNTNRVLLSGIAATAAMSVVAMFVAPMMGMPKMDFGVMLGSGNPMMPMPYFMGWIVHFMVGIIFAIIYATVAIKVLKGAYFFKGIIFAIGIFIMAQAVMMPMMGNGFFSNGNMSLIMGSLIGHLVFGVVLGIVYGHTK
jgi:uncharacterized membrane protein YagU involved in acid resistance